jgi:hypothetical protein
MHYFLIYSLTIPQYGSGYNKDIWMMSGWNAITCTKHGQTLTARVC